jgi:transcriptional regulator with XRE-family HTH domain
MPSAADKIRFARFIARALDDARARGMTDAQIVKATGINATTYYRWRNGQTAPTVDKVKQFCAGLGIPAREALAALGAAERTTAPPEPIVDPDVLALLRKLEDPHTNEATREYIRTTMRMLAAMSPQPQPPRRRKTG